MQIRESKKEISDDRKQVIRSINQKLQKQFNLHKGYANLVDAGLEAEEMAMVLPYARSGRHGPYMTIKQVELFLKKEGKVGVVSGEFSKSIPGATAGMSPSELAMVGRGFDPMTGQKPKKQMPDDIALSGPYSTLETLPNGQTRVVKAPDPSRRGKSAALESTEGEEEQKSEEADV